MTTQAWEITLYTISLNLVNYLVVLALIFLSFVNILHINIDTYGIKKAMPAIIMGVVLANFSVLICRVVVDAAELLIHAFNTKTLFDNLYGSIGLGAYVNLAANFSITNPIATGTTATVVGVVALTSIAGLLPGMASLGLLGAVFFGILYFIPLFIIWYLCLLFAIRWYVVAALVSVSPLAFAMLGLPMGQNIFKQWMDMFLKWTFMAPVAYFFLFLSGEIGKGSAGEATLGSILAATACAYAATQVPFKMGGALMSAWGGALKAVGKYGAKKGDKWLGDITEKVPGIKKRTNFSGLYNGWKERSAEIEASNKGRENALGRGTAEAANKGIGALFSKNFYKMGSIARENFQKEAALGISAQKKDIVTQTESEYDAMSGDNVDPATWKEGLKVATKKKDFETAKKLSALLARQGNLTAEERDAMIEAFGVNNTAMEALDQSFGELARKNPMSKNILGPALQRINGKVRRMSEGEQLANLERQLIGSLNSVNGAVQVGQAKRLGANLKAKKEEDWDYQDYAHRNALRELGQQHAVFREDPELARKVWENSAPSVKTIGIQDTKIRDFANRGLENGGYGLDMPGNGPITKDQADLAHKINTDLSSNNSELKKAFAESLEELQRSLHGISELEGIKKQHNNGNDIELNLSKSISGEMRKAIQNIGGDSGNKAREILRQHDQIVKIVDGAEKWSEKVREKAATGGTTKPMGLFERRSGGGNP